MDRLSQKMGHQTPKLPSENFSLLRTYPPETFPRSYSPLGQAQGQRSILHQEYWDQANFALCVLFGKGHLSGQNFTWKL